MAPKLYMIPASPPSRAVLLCAKSLGIDLEQVELDFAKKEHFSPNFIKLNPLHTVPTFVDEDGFVLCDSHVIMGYIVDKYGKDESLYPKDLKRRASIDQRLHFDSSVLFERGKTATRSILYKGMKKISQELIDSMYEAYGFLETFLLDNKWVAGEEMSVADFSAVTSVTSWNVLVPVEDSKYPKITAWIKQMENLPYYHEVNAVGLEAYKTVVQLNLSQ